MIQLRSSWHGVPPGNCNRTRRMTSRVGWRRCRRARTRVARIVRLACATTSARHRDHASGADAVVARVPYRLSAVRHAAAQPPCWQLSWSAEGATHKKAAARRGRGIRAATAGRAVSGRRRRTMASGRWSGAIAGCIKICVEGVLASSALPRTLLRQACNEGNALDCTRVRFATRVPWHDYCRFAVLRSNTSSMPPRIAAFFRKAVSCSWK